MQSPDRGIFTPKNAVLCLSVGAALLAGPRTMAETSNKDLHRAFAYNGITLVEEGNSRHFEFGLDYAEDIDLLKNAGCPQNEFKILKEQAAYVPPVDRVRNRDYTIVYSLDCQRVVSQTDANQSTSAQK